MGALVQLDIRITTAFVPKYSFEDLLEAVHRVRNGGLAAKSCATALYSRGIGDLTFRKA